MTDISEDFQSITKTAKDKRPFIYLWVFDPQTDHVYLENHKGEHPADYPTFDTIADHVTHPDRTEGFAIAIKDGWRIFTSELKEPDGFINKRVLNALADQHPHRLPHIRYHGDPHAQR